MSIARGKGGDTINDVTISLMEETHLREAVYVLSVAMLDNPLHVAVFQGKGEKEREEIVKEFNRLLAKVPGIVYLARIDGDIIGVMRMKSCSGSDPPEIDEEAEKRRDPAWRRSIWLGEWARRDPVQPHWHLGPIGVLPSMQQKGVGTLLMERFCRKVDADRLPAYLETDRDRNVAFYEKFGFEVIAKSEIFDVTSHYMWRTGLS